MHDLVFWALFGSAYLSIGAIFAWLLARIQWINPTDWKQRLAAAVLWPLVLVAGPLFAISTLIWMLIRGAFR
jgi:hypothetical protein